MHCQNAYFESAIVFVDLTVQFGKNSPVAFSRNFDYSGLISSFCHKELLVDFYIVNFTHLQTVMTHGTIGFMGAATVASTVSIFVPQPIL